MCTRKYIWHAHTCMMPCYSTYHIYFPSSGRGSGDLYSGDVVCDTLPDLGFASLWHGARVAVSGATGQISAISSDSTSAPTRTTSAFPLPAGSSPQAAITFSRCGPRWSPRWTRFVPRQIPPARNLRPPWSFICLSVGKTIVDYSNKVYLSEKL